MSTDDLMQERPDGRDPSLSSITDLVGVDTEEDEDFIEEEAGFGVVDTSRGSAGRDSLIGVKTYGATEAGMTAHRGVLQEGEHVDADELQAAVEAELGYTYAEVSVVYKVGGKPLTATQREQRTYIDARLLALSASGANITLVAEAIGLSLATVNRALARAREQYIERQPLATAVVRSRSCFTCDSMDAKPRKRRHSTSPPAWVGTIDLCDPCYSRGFAAEVERAGRIARLQARPPVTEADAARSRERMRELLRHGA